MSLRLAIIALAAALGLFVGPVSANVDLLKPGISQVEAKLQANGAALGEGTHCQVIGYEMALLNNDIVTAAKILANLSKPGVPETPVVALNEKLEIQMEAQVFAALLGKAREFQSMN